MQLVVRLSKGLVALMLVGTMIGAPIVTESAFAAVCKAEKKAAKTANKNYTKAQKDLDKKTATEAKFLGRYNAAVSNRTNRINAQIFTRDRKLASYQTRIDKINNDIQWTTVQMAAQEAIILVECIFLGDPGRCAKAQSMVEKYIRLRTKLEEKKDNTEDQRDNYTTQINARIAAMDAALADKEQRALDALNTATAAVATQTPIVAQLLTVKDAAELALNQCLAANP